MNARALACMLPTLVLAHPLHGFDAKFRVLFDRPIDISQEGAILVQSTSYHTPRYSYLYEADGSITSLDAFGGATSAAAISEDGNVIAGHASYPSSPHYLAWVKDRGEAFRTLGTLGGDRSLVHAMSADGQTLVGVSTDSQQRFRGFRWSEPTGMVEVDGLVGAVESIVFGISADGQTILGSSSFICPTCDPGLVIYDNDCAGNCAPPVARFNESFVWSVQTGAVSIGRLMEPDTEPNPLGLTPTPQSISANGISDDGTTVVGTTSGPDGSFIWRKDIGIEPIPNLAGHGHHFYPLDVSGDGSIVVGHVAGTGAVVWTRQRGTRLLQRVLAEEFGLGNEIADIFLEQATFVSANGKAIAGHAGDDRWWLVTLPYSLSAPEPSTLGMALIAFTFVTFVSRIRRS